MWIKFGFGPKPADRSLYNIAMEAIGISTTSTLVSAVALAVAVTAIDFGIISSQTRQNLLREVARACNKLRLPGRIAWALQRHANHIGHMDREQEQAINRAQAAKAEEGKADPEPKAS